MKVLLTGASGFIGSRLRQRLEAAGHTVTPVSRRPSEEGVDWSDEQLEPAVAESDAIVHLAGENLFGRRWSDRQKERLRSSRVETTERLAELAARHRPGCLLNASAIGYYGPCETEGLTEESPPGDDFLARLCQDWEGATRRASEAGVRTVIVRIGVVLGVEGGALEKMLLPFKLGVGGPLGSGRQWVSWIHLEDLVSLMELLLEREESSGPFNGTAPNPVRMKGFARALGKALHRPAVVPAPGFALRLALGEVADILLTGQHVLPRKAQEAGFEFRFEKVEAALSDLVGD